MNTALFVLALATVAGFIVWAYASGYRDGRSVPPPPVEPTHRRQR